MVQTVAVVGYAAAGIGGGLLAALVAFAPSFAFVLLGGARHFERAARPPGAQAFLDGAGPAAIGAILGSAIPLAGALREPWQYAVLAAAAVAAARRCAAASCSPCSPRPRPGWSSRWPAGRCHISGVRRIFLAVRGSQYA